MDHAIALNGSFVTLQQSPRPLHNSMDELERFMEFYKGSFKMHTGANNAQHRCSDKDEKNLWLEFVVGLYNCY